MKGRLDTAVNGCLLIATLLLVWRLSAGAKSKESSGAAFETVSDSIWRVSWFSVNVTGGWYYNGIVGV